MPVLSCLVIWDGERLLMRKRVAILHQGFIPVYRVKFYELLNRASDISYVVFHGAPPSDTGHQGFYSKL